MRLSGSARATAWSPEQPLALEGELRGDGVRLKVSGPSWDYRVRFVEPSVREVRASEGASAVSSREEDGGVTVVDVSGGGFELAAEIR